MKRSAFTLIELLVVIAVIAILMAILMPALNLARDQGRKMKCAANLRSLATANALYAANNDDWAVPCRFFGTLNGIRDYVLWTGNPQFRKCIGYDTTQVGLSTVQTPDKYKCPSDRQKAWAHAWNVEAGNTTGTLVSYGYNIEDWYPSVGTSSWTTTTAMTMLGYKMATIRHAAQKLQFNEGQDWWSKWKGANYIAGWDKLGQLGTVNQYKQAGAEGPTMYRHNEAANLAFYDGHVETWHKTKLWVPEYAQQKPYQPGMWVIKPDIWAKNGGGQ
jgi:prepilin-type N-terminal cleavage/methylation domain-containing protein/prepilin-type processing-associated H-X9-DG protein